MHCIMVVCFDVCSWCSPALKFDGSTKERMTMKKMMISLFTVAGLLLSGVSFAGDVARAIVTTGVAEREPVNDLERVLAGNEQVLFFTELSEMEGQTVTHRWSYGGEVMAEVAFNVGGPRWRVWSSKNLIPEWAGEWKVEVVDGEGNVVHEKNFAFDAEMVSAPAEMESAPAEMEAMPMEEAVGEMPPAE